MSREDLNTLVERYDENPSSETQAAIENLLKKHTLYFKKYYKNTDGTGVKTCANFQEKGSFVEFTESKEFNKPSLLSVEKEDGQIVYVSLNDFSFE